MLSPSGGWLSGRALPSHGRCQGFESLTAHYLVPSSVFEQDAWRVMVLTDM